MHHPTHHSPRYLSSQEQLRRWGLLGVLTPPLLGAVFYGQGYKLPGLTCPIRELTGCPCPTCGMTRSFAALTQGHWQEAVTMHLFGPILLGVFAIATLHITLELITQQKYSPRYAQLLHNPTFQLLGVGVYLGYYLLRLLLIGYPENFISPVL